MTEPGFNLKSLWHKKDFKILRGDAEKNYSWFLLDIFICQDTSDWVSIASRSSLWQISYK